MTPLSQSSTLRLFTLIPASITLSYAYTYFFNPGAAATIFEFDHLPTGRDEYIFKSLMGLLGAKVTFIAFSLFAATLCATPKYLGAMQLGVACMAYIDGIVVKRYFGHGEWNHWGYASGLVVHGMLLLGAFDRRRGH